MWISIKIWLKFGPRGQINNNPALGQVMAWRRPGDKPLSEPMMVRLYASLGPNVLTSCQMNPWEQMSVHVQQTSTLKIEWKWKCSQQNVGLSILPCVPILKPLPAVYQPGPLFPQYHLPQPTPMMNVSTWRQVISLPASNISLHIPLNSTISCHCQSTRTWFYVWLDFCG